jgi:hypothetical protein
MTDERAVLEVDGAHVRAHRLPTQGNMHRSR